MAMIPATFYRAPIIPQALCFPCGSCKSLHVHRSCFPLTCVSVTSPLGNSSQGTVTVPPWRRSFEPHL